VVLITIQLKDEKGTYLIEKVIASVTLPFLEFSKKTSYFVERGVNTYILNVNSAKRYYKLLEKVKRLESEHITCRYLKRENIRLKSLLNLKYTYDYFFLGTRVIDTSVFTGLSIITIDKGKNSGVRENCAVIDSKGVVGRVWKVFPNQSQVQLISDKSSGVGVIIEERGVGGILIGTGDLYYGELDYVPRGVMVKEGDSIVTSGTDGIYPPNIFVGRVVNVKDKGEFFLNIKVKYAASLSSLRELVVILNGEKGNGK